MNSAEVRQGDLLGPIISALCLRKLTDLIQERGIYFQTWYLDDGLPKENRANIRKAISIIKNEGPRFGPILDETKSTHYWPMSEEISSNTRCLG